MNAYREFFEARGVALQKRALDLSTVFPEHAHYRNYQIIITGRCGSTWFGTMLADLGCVGHPEEWFNTEGFPALFDARGATDLADYVAKIAALYPVFGMQINPERLFALGELIDLRATFRGFAYIDLRRRDFVSQAVSFARARATGLWHQRTAVDVEIEDDEIWEMISAVIDQERRIDAWYRKAGINPLRIVYEDVLADPTLALLRVLRHINRKNAAPTFAPPPHRQKRLREDGADDGVLSFYRRHADRIEAIHAARSKSGMRTALLGL